MKYRRLDLSELAELEQEFIRFLAANSIPADEWELLKKEDADRANALIDQFSDVVFEKVIYNVEYLELKLPKDVRTFHCLQDKIVMNGLLVEGETSLDFTKNMDTQAMLQMVRLADAKVKLYSGEKAYQPSREEEIFKLMEQGALISKDGYLFKELEGLKG